MVTSIQIDVIFREVKNTKIKQIKVSRKFPVDPVNNKFEMLEIEAIATLTKDEDLVENWKILDEKTIKYADKYYPTRKILKAKNNPDKFKPVDTAAINLVKNAFSADLEKLLNFTDKGSYIRVKAKEYLDSQIFARIGAIIRNLNGEYIKGKDSHFRVYKK